MAEDTSSERGRIQFMTRRREPVPPSEWGVRCRSMCRTLVVGCLVGGCAATVAGLIDAFVSLFSVNLLGSMLTADLITVGVAALVAMIPLYGGAQSKVPESELQHRLAPVAIGCMAIGLGLLTAGVAASILGAMGAPVTGAGDAASFGWVAGAAATAAGIPLSVMAFHGRWQEPREVY